jgi:hypothetical protein
MQTTSTQTTSTSIYDSLSFVEKWRVVFLLRRGRAAADSRIAQATVEFGEEWQQRHSRRIRLFTVVVGPFVAGTIVLAATWGDTLYLVMQAVFLGLISSQCHDRASILAAASGALDRVEPSDRHRASPDGAEHRIAPTIPRTLHPTPAERQRDAAWETARVPGAAAEPT